MKWKMETAIGEEKGIIKALVQFTMNTKYGRRHLLSQALANLKAVSCMHLHNLVHFGI